MPKTFKLEQNDVLKSWCGRHAGSLRGSKITLIHAPTRLEVSAEIAEGKFTNKQIKALEVALEIELLEALTQKVAKHLRISGL